MKKELFDAISSWHQEQKKALEKDANCLAQPLMIKQFSSNIDDEEQALSALSETLGYTIRLEKLIWGIPNGRKRPSSLEFNCGYLYKAPNLGWFLIWKYDNKIQFLDKNLFEVEKCYSFGTRQIAFRTLIQDIKFKSIFFLILIAVAAICIILK